MSAVGVGAIAMLMKTDVRTSASMLRRNLRHIRSWMEETAATRYAQYSTETLFYHDVASPIDYLYIYCSEQTATKQIKSGKKPPSSEGPVNDKL